MKEGGGVEYSKKKSRNYILISLVLIILTFMSAVFFDFLSLKYPFFIKHAAYFYNTRKINILLISVLLFLGFRNFEFYNKKINFLAPMTFAIYLLQENPILRPILWQKIFKSSKFIASPLLVPYSLMVIALVMIVSFLIEFIRIYFVEKKYLNILKKLEEKIKNIINCIVNSKIYKSL